MLLYDSSHISKGKCRRDKGELFDKTLFDTNFITGEPVYPLLHWYIWYHLGARVHGSMVFLYSFQGVFNILIYSRPNVKLLHMQNPEYSWLYAFWTILKAVGDLPVAASEVLQDKSVDYHVDEGFEENPDAAKFPTSMGDSYQACLSYDVNTSNVISYDEDPDTKKSEADQYREMRLNHNVNF